MKTIKNKNIAGLISHTVAKATIAIAAMAILTACTSDDLASDTDSQAGELHLASVTAGDAVTTKASTRVIFDDNSGTTTWTPNHVINGFSAGDKLNMDYIFSQNGYAADLTLGSDGKWTMAATTFPESTVTAVQTRPNQNGVTGEQWENAAIVGISAYPCDANGWMKNENSIKTYEKTNSIYKYYDCLCASKSAESADAVKTSTDKLGAWYIDCGITSSTLGAITTKLAHLFSLLRIDADNALSISGYAEGYTKLTALTAKVGDEAIAFDYVTVTKDNKDYHYWQAIVPTGKLTSLTPTIGDGTNTATLQAVSINNGNGATMVQDYRYNINLTLSPTKMQATINIQTLPGWGTTGELDQTSDALQDITLKTAAASDPTFAENTQYYEIYTAKGLDIFRQMVNGELASSTYTFTTSGIYKLYTNDDNSTTLLSAGNAANARLMKDIDLSTVCAKVDGTATNDKSWTPIGNSLEYSGTFDGNDKTINNLYINTTTGRQGLFGLVQGTATNKATIKDLTLTNANVTSTAINVGTLIGYLYNYTIVSNCKTSGTVTGLQNTGGMIGISNPDESSRNTITNCSSSATVKYTATNNTEACSGGLIGSCYYTDISGSYATGNVTNKNNGDNAACYNVGGLLGDITGATVSSCHATGAVKGSRDIGGLIGYCYAVVIASYATGTVTATNGYAGGIAGSNEGTITACYATGAVTATNGYAGGIAGYNDGTITACYATGAVKTTNGDAGGIAGFNGSTVQYCATTQSNGTNGIGYNDVTTGTVTNCTISSENIRSNISVPTSVSVGTDGSLIKDGTVTIDGTKYSLGAANGTSIWSATNWTDSEGITFNPTIDGKNAPKLYWYK